ncbi:hypothetical protein CLV97_13313 [Planifilum fimeticola]|uniref:Uncharacterized protein n=1 Tax=Planifilum fimeticola TaxID=201975 RepID=A0A2T0LAP4_9BACL|nr:hypothetical protein CLV97_13313 [Planifilum fimeticola]
MAILRFISLCLLTGLLIYFVYTFIPEALNIIFWGAVIILPALLYLAFREEWKRLTKKKNE